MVIFGDSLRAAESTDPAEWIAESLRGQPGTVGAVVPNLFESTFLPHAPDPTPDGWWELYRDLFDLVASVGVRYTSTPTLAWFAIREGHGFVPSIGQMGWRNPPADEAERQWREVQRERQRESDRERNAVDRTRPASVPRFDLPDRAYYLVHGPLSAMTELRYPDFDGWRNPDRSGRTIDRGSLRPTSTSGRSTSVDRKPSPANSRPTCRHRASSSATATACRSKTGAGGSASASADGVPILAEWFMVGSWSRRRRTRSQSIPTHPYNSADWGGREGRTSRTRSTWSRDCATRRNTSWTARSDPRHLRRHRADPTAGHLPGDLRPAYRVILSLG